MSDSEVRRDSNIFQQYFKVKEYLTNNADIYGEECFSLLKEFDKYLYSFVWAKDRVDRALLLKGKELSIKDISLMYEISYTTLRKRVSLFTRTFSDKFFNGETFDIDLFTADIETIKVYTKNIHFANINFDFYKDFDESILYHIHKRTNEKDNTNIEPTQADIYQVLLAYARFSDKAIENWFSNLNPKAMDYVNTCLLSGKFTKELQQFEFLRNRAGYQTMNNKALQQIAEVVGEDFSGEVD